MWIGLDSGGTAVGLVSGQGQWVHLGHSFIRLHSGSQSRLNTVGGGQEGGNTFQAVEVVE